MMNDITDNKISMKNSIATVAIFAIAYTLSLFFIPALILPTILLTLLLLGGRTKTALTALAASALISIPISGLPTALICLFIVLVCSLSVFFYISKFSGRGHFNGLLVSSVAIALALALCYGALWLLMRGDPITMTCNAFDKLLAEDTSVGSEDLLRMLWSSENVLYLAESGTTASIANSVSIVQKSYSLTRAELAEQTKGFFEVLARNSLPTLLIYVVTLGGLLNYTIPVLVFSNPGRSLSKTLLLKERKLKKLPEFDSWELPRDIGRWLFIALALMLVASFINTDMFSTPLTVIYQLFSAVFYVQGLSFAMFMMKRWNWNKPLRIVLVCVLGVVLPSIASMFGVVDYITRLRVFLRVLPKKGDPARKNGQIHINMKWDDVFPSEKPDNGTDNDSNDQNANDAEPDGSANAGEQNEVCGDASQSDDAPEDRGDGSPRE